MIIIFGLLGSAFISATEAAVLDASRYRIEHLGEEGDKRASLVVRVFDQYEKFFGTILLVGNLFNVMVASVGTTLAISTIGGGTPTLLSTAIATGIATVVVVVVGCWLLLLPFKLPYHLFCCLLYTSDAADE